MSRVFKILKKHWRLVALDSVAGILIIFLTAFTLSYFLQSAALRFEVKVLNNQKSQLTTTLAATQKTLQATQSAYTVLKNEDQYKINQQLQKDLKLTHDGYKNSIENFELIQDLKSKKQKTDSLELLYASVVKNLSDLHHATASALLIEMNAKIKKIQNDLAAIESAKNAPGGNPPSTASNIPPASGFSYQLVKSDIGDFSVSIVAADLNSTRVVVDTASDGDCRDNCPLLSLGDYVSRSGAYAGINGSYLCPASYPSCAGKANSFDTLVMNKNKKYLNSDNNIYSTVPVAVFGSGFARFLGQSSGWGRDTGVDGVIANQPLLLSGGNISFGGGSDPKQGSKGARSFVGNRGSIIYIGVVYNATVAEVAHVLKTLGLENALNLDSGGSTALWSGGYKAGPGRNIPNAVLFIRR